MTGKPLDGDIGQFREAGHAAIDWIAEYLTTLENLPVLSQVVPGEIRSGLPSMAPASGRPLADLLEDFEKKILPGITHWNHPAFFAYFAITGSRAGILGELLSAALNVNGMLWKTSPAVTELELTTLDWLRQLVDLPPGFFGIINDTASINSFLALAAARESLGLSIRAEGLTGRALPLLRIYQSDQAHSSIEKAALALGLGVAGVAKIRTDERFRMDPQHLSEMIASDRANGALPCAIVATAGTTSTAAIDPLAEIAAIAEREKIWLHVDAAYGGSAAILPFVRKLFAGIERADSIVMNPHKWLFTPVDCSVLYTRRPDVLKETFSLVPEYLKTSDTAEVNYMDYGLQLGRRFRSLKLWMVLEHYGVAELQRVIGQHIELASRLAGELTAMPGVELLAPQSLGVVVFRQTILTPAGEVDEVESERVTAGLLERINAAGRAFVSHTRLRGRYAIRVAIGNGATEWKHIERILEKVKSEE